MENQNQIMRCEHFGYGPENYQIGTSIENCFLIYCLFYSLVATINVLKFFSTDVYTDKILMEHLRPNLTHS